MASVSTATTGAPVKQDEVGADAQLLAGGGDRAAVYPDQSVVGGITEDASGTLTPTERRRAVEEWRNGIETFRRYRRASESTPPS
ncbi:MAG: hypothetical protein WBN99_04020 [Mycobacterium sp.]